MKSSFLRYCIPFFLGISILISGLLLLKPSTEFHQFLPQSGGKTRLLGKDENESEEHRRRQIWIEQIHKAAPGTDWRAMDRKARWKKYQE